jgi:hypothetical protein
MFTFTYICIYICMVVCMDVWIYAFLCINVPIHVYICMYAVTCKFDHPEKTSSTGGKYVYIYIYTYMFIGRSMCVYICLYVCLYVRMYSYMYVATCNFNYPGIVFLTVYINVNIYTYMLQHAAYICK